ncbi:MAG: N-acetylmuramoyl-L-alanine amidase, partial [Thermoleophilia bacterium]
LLAAITVTLALALPAVASASLASITFRSVPVAPGKSLPVTTGRFDLVGLRWHGPGSVQFSVRSTDGIWGPWLAAAPEEDDRPDIGARENASSGGWRLGNPTWVGPANAIRYRVSGRVTDLRASLVRSPEQMIPLRSVASAGSPPIVPRSAWGADESITSAGSGYAPSVRFAMVHHTAGPNDYSPSQAAAIMRGIQVYHVKSNGWADIGYNFLVDRYGIVYEGRHGGIDKNVIGAHALGFNTGSVGVAMIGTFGTAALPVEASRALERLLAWRLDLAHVDPRASVTVISGGSPQYLPGVPVLLRAVSGHRDTGQTECPGNLLYAKLDAVAGTALGIGLPKIFDPAVKGALGGQVRFTARVSAALAWRISVVDALGQELAAGVGRGPNVDWSWDASLVTGTGIGWSMRVEGATPATGALGKPTKDATLALRDLAADPETISPNDDGVADAATVTYETTAVATVTATLLDATGAEVAEIVPPTRLPAGKHTFAFDGLGQPDGVYGIVVRGTDARGFVVEEQIEITIIRTLGPSSVAPSVFTPNGDGKGDVLRMTFLLTTAAAVRLRILHEGVWVATLFNGPLLAGKQTITWDGTKRLGTAPDGDYTAVVEVTDAIGTITVALPFLRDATPPGMRLFSRPLRLRVSEAAQVTVRVNGSVRHLETAGPGYLMLAGVRRIRTLLVFARDTAGNQAVLRRP